MSDMKNKKMMLQATRDNSASRNFSVLQARLSALGTRYQSRDPSRIKTMVDLEHQVEKNFIEDSEVASVESEIEEETDIELTLSTGSSNKKKKKKKEPIYWNLDGSFPSMLARSDSIQTPVVGSDPWLNSRERLTGPSWKNFCNEQKKSYSEEELSRKERQPLWLFPVLSLNVT